MSGPHWVCPCSRCVCFPSLHYSGSTLLCRNCLKQALHYVHFPDLSHSVSGSWVLHKGTDSVGPAFCVLPTSEQLRRPGAQCARHLRCAVCLLWGADLWLRSSWQMSTVQDPRKTWLAAGRLLTVWWRMPSLGPRLPLVFRLWLSHACLSASGGGMGQSAAG